MKFVGRKVEDNAGKLVRKAAIAADSAIVLATPVDTGRARANWVTSIGAPAIHYTEGAKDPTGQATMAENQSVIAGYKSGDGGIYITNAVPYIMRLEEGYSAQAPGGMSKFGLQAARAVLSQGGLLEDV